MSAFQITDVTPEIKNTGGLQMTTLPDEIPTEYRIDITRAVENLQG